jgi:hypothetical protein
MTVNYLLSLVNSVIGNVSNVVDGLQQQQEIIKTLESRIVKLERMLLPTEKTDKGILQDTPVVVCVEEDSDPCTHGSYQVSQE